MDDERCTSTRLFHMLRFQYIFKLKSIRDTTPLLVIKLKYSIDRRLQNNTYASCVYFNAKTMTVFPLPLEKNYKKIKLFIDEKFGKIFFRNSPKVAGSILQ